MRTGMREIPNAYGAPSARVTARESNFIKIEELQQQKQKNLSYDLFSFFEFLLKK